jgi:hypothetical protein
VDDASCSHPSTRDVYGHDPSAPDRNLTGAARSLRPVGDESGREPHECVEAGREAQREVPARWYGRRIRMALASRGRHPTGDGSPVWSRNQADGHPECALDRPFRWGERARARAQHRGEHEDEQCRHWNHPSFHGDRFDSSPGRVVRSSSGRLRTRVPEHGAKPGLTAPTPPAVPSPAEANRSTQRRIVTGDRTSSVAGRDRSADEMPDRAD